MCYGLMFYIFLFIKTPHNLIIVNCNADAKKENKKVQKAK